jgi:hypothetical protein
VGVVTASAQSGLSVGGSKCTSLRDSSDELSSSGVQFIYRRRRGNVLTLTADILTPQTSPLLQQVCKVIFNPTKATDISTAATGM